MKTARSLTDQPLPLEDGIPAARILPFDIQNSETAFETATFGLG